MRQAFLFILLFLASCSPATPVLMVQPKSGDTTWCTVDKLHYFYSTRLIENCVEQLESIGYVQAEKLTPEDRARLAPPR
jgi:hypothetical protein